MATKTFTTFVQLEGMINQCITRAVGEASNILLSKLQEYVMEDYYNLLKPEVYSRTMQFYDSAKAQLLSANSAQIYMDVDSMSYGSYWDGETQLFMADAGFHGNVSIFREGYFWKDFLAYCDANAIKILKVELKKQGLNVK